MGTPMESISTFDIVVRNGSACNAGADVVTTMARSRIAVCEAILIATLLGCATHRPFAKENAALPAPVSVPAATDATSKVQTAVYLAAPELPTQPTAVLADESVSAHAIAPLEPASTVSGPAELPAPAAPENICRLDMSTALALVAGQNPQVGYARWRIREAYANLEQAHSLWLPSIQAGVSYHHNEGALQDSGGAILDVSRSSLQAGLGAGAVGAGTTPMPGIVAQFQLVDAIFQPAIAQRNAWRKNTLATLFSTTSSSKPRLPIKSYSERTSFAPWQWKQLPAPGAGSVNDKLCRRRARHSCGCGSLAGGTGAS